MSNSKAMLLTLAVLGVLLACLSGGVEAGLFGFGGDSWQEEVLLHDGTKMVVTRSQTYGGRREVGQPPPIKEHTIAFTPPGLDKRITWTSEYGEDLGRTNFHLLAVHVLNGTPYLVTEPNLCLSYNKWGRPNPPYVFFKYDGTAWQRIPLEAFPTEFTTINVALSIIGREGTELVRQGFVLAEKIKELNRHTVNPDHKTILREPMKLGTEGSAVNCQEMIHYKCGWFGTSPDGKFNKEFADRMCNK
ncbi:MAG: hypothetical protein H8K04_05540 [Nitrospira sp.]